MVFGKWKYIVHTILAFTNLSEKKKTNIILMVLLLFLTYSLSPKDFKIFFILRYHFHDISDKFTSHLTFNILLTLNEWCFTLDPSANIQASLWFILLGKLSTKELFEFFLIFLSIIMWISFQNVFIYIIVLLRNTQRSKILISQETEP